MPRLVVNPQKPDAWEIQLKQGPNRIGRSDSNDFQISDPSVSSAHCQILVGNDVATIQDLASTNGTFINGERVHEVVLLNAQKIRLGSVDLVYFAAAPAPEIAVVPPITPIAPLPSRLRISSLTAPVEETAPSPVQEAPPPMVAPISTYGSGFCKFHPKTAATWMCHKCNRSFCDLCVTQRNIGGVMKKMCRSCGVECVPLKVTLTQKEEKGFFASLPGAVIYPFRGSGILVLIFSTFLFAGLRAMAGIFSILLTIVAIGYLFSYMQNIIHATANEEAEMPELPGMDDVFGGFLRLAGCVVMSFGLTIAALIARFSGIDLPSSAILITTLAGCLYFPMAFLVVAIKDNVMACNPLVVIPSIIKIPLHYLVTVFIFMAIFVVQRVGDLLAGGAKALTFSTTDMSVLFMAIGFRMIWSFLSVYFLTVNMRVLGLLYGTQKEKLGW